MKVIIAGSRTITGNLLVHEAIEESGFKLDITEVVCGGAEGVDDSGDAWALERGLPVQYFLVHPCTRLRLLRNKRECAHRGFTEPFANHYENVRYAAEWKDGYRAGQDRNRAMADYADALIAVHDGKSRGTAGMIRFARARGLKVYVKTYVVPAPAPQESAE